MVGDVGVPQVVDNLWSHVGRGAVIVSVNIPAAGGSQEETEYLVAEHSPWGGGGKKEARVRVPPNGVRFRMGLKFKCWAKKLDRSPAVRSEPPMVRKKVRS